MWQSRLKFIIIYIFKKMSGSQAPEGPFKDTALDRLRSNDKYYGKD